MINVLVKRQDVMLTTSRRPTSAIRILCRDLSCTFPNIAQINRGKLSLEGIAERALELDVQKVVVVDRWERGLGITEFFYVGQDGLEGVPPIVYVRSVKFRRDFVERTSKDRRIKSVAIATSSKENFETKRFEDFLSEFFEVPVLPLQDALNKGYNAVMRISVDSSSCITITFQHPSESVEIGPQIAISKLFWELIQ